MKNALFVIIATVSFLFFSYSCKTKSVENKEKEAVKIKITQIETIHYNYQVVSSGRISSKDEKKLSFKTGGLINSILVSEGEYVNHGEVLATLNLSEINAMENQAKLAYEKAKRDFQRAKNLYNDSVATLEQYENAKTALNYAKSNVEIAEFNLQHSTIIAPENGTILKKLASENEIIAQGYPVFLFGKESQNWLLKVNVSDKDIVFIAIGDTAEILLDAYPGEKMIGIIYETGKYADPYTGTYEVVIQINANKKKLLSGMIAKAIISTKKNEPFLLIPFLSLIEANEDEGFVYKIVNGEVLKQSIHISKILDDGILTKSNGINQGDTIITDGVNYIKPGMPFEIIK